MIGLRESAVCVGLAALLFGRLVDSLGGAVWVVALVALVLMLVVDG